MNGLPERPLMRPQVGRYRHYAGGLYHVFGTAIDAGDRTVRVIYRPVGSVATVFEACRLEHWCEPVLEKGKRVPRFVKVASPGELEHAGEDWP